MSRVDKPDENVRRVVHENAKKILQKAKPGSDEYDKALESAESSSKGNWVTAQEEQRRLREWQSRG